MKALVVDDARVARLVVARMMQDLGFEVETAEHGQAAIDLLDPSDPPDAVVTDWNMPVMDGVEFAKQLRARPVFAQVPVLMISSESDPRRVARAIMSGVDEYLFKPVDAAMVAERLAIMGVHTGQPA